MSFGYRGTEFGGPERGKERGNKGERDMEAVPTGSDTGSKK